MNISKEIENIKTILRELIAVYEQETLIDTGLLEKLDVRSATHTEKTDALDSLLHGIDPAFLETEKKELPIEKHLNKRGKKFLKGLLEVDLGGEKEVEDTGLDIGHIETVVESIPLREKTDSKLPEPIMFDCLYCGKSFEAEKNYDKNGNITSVCFECRNKPKEKTEPEKSIYGENYDFIKIIEERVRGATRKELIDEFLEKLRNIPIWSSKDNIFTVHQADINEIIEEYERRVK